MIKWIKEWWHGKDTYEDDRHSSLQFIMPLNKKHWTSKQAHKIWDFYIKNWKFIWELIIGVATAIFIAKFFG